MGKNIAIITDTDSSLPVELAKKYHIEQVPITIHFGDRSFTTGVDINDQTVFEMVDRLNKIPTTAAPSPGAFAEVFKKAFREGADAVVCICVSSKISATYSAAVTAREMMPEKDITIIDSLNLSMGQGLISLSVAEALSRGAKPGDIQPLVDNLNPRLHTFALLPSLKYLAMSGRVGKLAAGMADTLLIKPILTTREGKLELLEKIRTNRKALIRLLELTRESVGDNQIERMAIIHVNNPGGANELEMELRKILVCPAEVIHAEFSAGLSVHAGNGVVGVVIQTNR